MKFSTIAAMPEAKTGAPIPRKWIELTGRLILLGGLIASRPGFPCNAAAPASPANRGPELARAAMALLRDHCLSCHNPKKRKGGLVLTTRAGLQSGSDDGPVVEVNPAAQSLLIEVLAPDADPHMPPKDQLDPAQIQALAAWVKAGTPWNREILEDQGQTLGPVTLHPLPHAYQPVFAMKIDPRSEVLAVAHGSELLAFSLEKPELTLISRMRGHRDAVRSVAINPTAKLIATGSFQKIMLTPFNSAAQTRELSLDLKGRITDLEFSPDGTFLWIADSLPARGGWIHLWQMDASRPLASFRAHSDTVYDLAISPEGNYLASASADRQVRIWELDTLHRVASLEGHSLQVLGVAFDRDATRLVSCGSDQQLKVWDLSSHDPLFALGRPSWGLTSVLWTAENDFIIAADEAGQIKQYTDITRHTGAAGARAAKEKTIGNARGLVYTLTYDAVHKIVYAGLASGRVLRFSLKGKALGELVLPPVVDQSSS